MIKFSEQTLKKQLRKILMFAFLFSAAVFADDTLSTWQFGFNLGAGPSYSIYALKLTIDNDFCGAELFFSPLQFPNNFGANIHINIYFARGSIRISPSLSVGHRKGTPPFQLKEYDCRWSSANIDFTGYISNHIYLRHQYGIEIVRNTDYILPSYGIGIGFDVRGAIYKNNFYSQNKIFNAVGFGLGTVLIIGIHMMYMSILSWD